MTDDDPKKALAAYIALARGPGAIQRVAEGTFDEPLPDDVELEPDAISTELPAYAESPRKLRPRVKSEPIDLTEDAELDVPPTPMYLRVLEELSAYVAPAKADRALRKSLESAGIHPDEATSLDLREAVVEALPIMLGKMFSDEDLQTVLERLETALTHAIVPSRGTPSE